MSKYYEVTSDERPWGSYRVLADSCEHAYKIKEIIVNPKQAFSYQYHNKRKELWYVVSGSGEVTIDDLKHAIRPGSLLVIHPGVKHRARCISETPLVFVEIQEAVDGKLSSLVETDICRIEDEYGRV